MLNKLVFPSFNRKSLDLCCLIAIYEDLFMTESTLQIDVSPHSINIEERTFCYSPEYSPQITTDKVSSLKYLVKTFGIKELTLNKCSFTEEAINHLCDLIKVKNHLTSVMDGF
ncbi:hypothetical protein GEMRC1_010069 [Eukaryota sp. GEM-RC1]